MTLFHQLETGMVPCNLAENKLGSSFLPKDIVDELVTTESIAANLSWWDLLWSLPNQVHAQAPKLFAVLVLIGQPSAIRKLIYNDNITDNDLPLIREGSDNGAIFDKTRKKKFTSFQSWAPPNVSAFFDKQWIIQAPVLDTAGQNLKLHPNCPLPVKSCTHKISSGGVTVYQVWLHPAHAPLSISDSPFAFKEIWDKDVFEREKKNLNLIQGLGNQHLVKLVACLEQEPFGTGWFVFKWASGGNLWEFWEREGKIRERQGSSEKEASPSIVISWEDGVVGDTPQKEELQLTLWFLEQALGLVQAICLLHKKQIRHGDIKPQNILHDTEGGEEHGRGTLVLADVGISKFHEHATGLRASATDTVESTAIYEAPEVLYDHQTGEARSRRYDMWPMGCTFLEFIVWLLYGFEAVETFRKRRIGSRAKYFNPRAAFFRGSTREDSIIHPEVTKAFDKLAPDPRCGDGTALADFLELIKTDLLRIDPNARATGPVLVEKLEAIVQRARGDPLYLCGRARGPLETPNFFLRGPNRKGSDSSQSSSASSGSFLPIRGSLRNSESQ